MIKYNIQLSVKMCKRFIEDLSSKIIEKLELNDYTSKKLRSTMEECKTLRNVKKILLSSSKKSII
jgi:hypothetical protein